MVSNMKWQKKHTISTLVRKERLETSGRSLKWPLGLTASHMRKLYIPMETRCWILCKVQGVIETLNTFCTSKVALDIYYLLICSRYVRYVKKKLLYSFLMIIQNILKIYLKTFWDKRMFRYILNTIHFT